MRFLIFMVAGLPISSCVQSKPLRQVKPAVPVHQSPEIQAAPALSPALPPRLTVRVLAGITFEGVAFDSRTHRLAVLDQPDGPGSQFADSQSAARSRGGVSAVNAGFFTPEGTPLGLVVASGKISGSWNTGSSLCSGVWHETTTGRTAITRREKIGRSAAPAMRELIQAGPLLVENNRTFSGLEATKASARTLLLWDGATRWWMGRGSPSTLAAVGQVLAASQPAGWPVRAALNLDGGRSSDLWISDAVPGGPILRRAPWNRPVRNFLVLVAK